MPIPIAITLVLFLVGFFYIGGYLFVIILALAYQVFRHVSKQNQGTGKWRIETGILMSYLVLFGFIGFIALIFPFFPFSARNILIFTLILCGACLYSFLMSLKK
jgi:1,4-dihydroxy-2-naphthoate octaprenyltransferase